MQNTFYSKNIMFLFLCRKTCLKHNIFTPTKRLSSRYIHILAVPNKRIDLFEKPCSFQFFSTSKQSSVFEEFASHHVADDDMHVLFCMKYCKNENKILWRGASPTHPAAAGLRSKPSSCRTPTAKHPVKLSPRMDKASIFDRSLKGKTKTFH